MFNILSIGDPILDWGSINDKLSNSEFDLSVKEVASLAVFEIPADETNPDLILYDHSQGLHGIQQIAAAFPGVAIAYLSEGFEGAIEAMKVGAEDFIVPSSMASNEDLLIVVINKWARHQKQIKSNENLRKQKLLQQFSGMFSSVTNSMVRSLSMKEIDSKDIIDILQLLGELMALDSCSVGFFEDGALAADRYFVWTPNQKKSKELFEDGTKTLTLPDTLWSIRELKQGRSIVVNTIDDLPKEAVPERKQFEATGAKSSLMIPLSTEKELLGFMRLATFSKVHVWQAPEIDISEACAGIFVALQLRWNNLNQLHNSVAALEQKNLEISAINQMSVRLQRCKNMTQIYAVNEEFSQALFPNTVGMIHLVKKNGQPSSMTQWGEWPFSLLVSVEQIFFSASEAAMNNTVDIDVICAQFEQQLRESSSTVKTICIPLYAQSETIGLFALFFLDEAVPTEEIRSLATSYAERLALAISNLQLRDNLHYHSVRDPLTGLYNRRFMEHVFENEVRRATRRNYALSVLMMDIDHFKQVNDSLGHEVGDIVLRAVAKYLKKYLRKEDIVCRFGGDEFVILLPQTKASEAYQRADFLCKSRLEIFEDPLIAEFSVDYLTLSFGISSFPVHGIEPPELLRSADHALYYSKNHGRNQVRIAPKDITGSLYSKTRQKLDAQRWGVGRSEEEKVVAKKMPVLLGSNNRGKLIEIEAILRDAPFFDQLEFFLPADIHLSLDVDETGSSYAENAALKARAFFEAARSKFEQFIVLADDSGLEVDALGGQPGIRSARYAPFPNATDADRRRYLLQELRSKPAPWRAHFHCTIAMISPDGDLHLFDGVCPGSIVSQERGEYGFGYDPIFYLPEYNLTMAELEDAEKNKISHRGAALRNALPSIQKIIN